MALWNGNIDPALRLVDGLKTMLAGEGISAERQKYSGQSGLHSGLRRSLPQSRKDQYRVYGSAVNQLVSRRMVKQQQMHWIERGAHLLLQVRVQVMNGDLRQTFSRWYGDENGHRTVPLVA